jgi:glycosyltransferase involved in cell wall biosynthesis
MKKILFYIQNGWAFGSLHHSLIKELYKHGIYGDLLDWNVSYTLEEFELLIDGYDLFVTLPEAVMVLHQSYKVPLNKIVVVVHEQWDLYLTKRDIGNDFYKDVYGYSVISDILVGVSKNIGIDRKPDITPCGISFEKFYNPIQTSVLKNIGYAGAKVSLNFFGVDRKRGYLVENIVNGIDGLNLVSHGFYNFMCMSSYYKKLDCVIVSSSEEAGGLPAMEAAAAGKLVISTPLGYFEEHGPKGGGVVVPVDETEFVNSTREALIFYKNNPTEYWYKCKQIQEYAREHYDWSKNIEPWLNLLNK